MRSYIAVCRPGVRYDGGWYECVIWAIKRIGTGGVPVQIYSARVGEGDAELTAEVSGDGVRQLPRGRFVAVRKLLKIPHE